MRADRLLSILLLLQVHRHITAGELARRLEVSERTIYRDMDALSVAGIPVFAERGAGGGWILREEYRTNLTGLNEAEIQALFLTKPAHLLSDLGLRQASEAALIKLLAALPAISRRGAQYARQRIYVDASGWNYFEEDVTFLPIIQEAIWQERKLQFTYERNETTFERQVDPLGLVAKGRIWYFVAATEEGEPRTYRVSRVRSAQVMDELCVRPSDFDLELYWRQSSVTFKARIPKYPVTVRVAPEILEWVRNPGMYVTVEQEEPPDEQGRVKLELLFEVEGEACNFAFRFGAQLEILEPQSLRERVIRSAREILNFYEKGATQVMEI